MNLSALVEALEAIYGPPPPIPRFEPMDELVSCILSQHTADANSLPAFFRLKEAFPSYEKVAEQPAEAIAEIIRNAGLANQKSKSILGVLRAIRERTGTYGIDLLASLSMPEARAWLESLPGVGPKTASIVLCFSFRMDAVPVDTHVFRVGKRLGLIPDKMGADPAHNHLLQIVPPGLAYRLHMALIQHGRAVCRAPKPHCERCPIKELCRWPGKPRALRKPAARKP